MHDETTENQETTPPAHRVPGCRRLISAVILGCLGMQLIVFVPSLQDHIPHFPYYPFLKYGMYADAHTGIPETTTTKMYATMADGSTAPCSHKDLGILFFVWEYDYVRPMQEGGPGDERAQVAAEFIAQRAQKMHGQPVSVLYLETIAYRIPENEIVKETTLHTFTFNAEVSP